MELGRQGQLFEAYPEEWQTIRVHHRVKQMAGKRSLKVCKYGLD